MGKEVIEWMKARGRGGWQRLLTAVLSSLFFVSSGTTAWGASFFGGGLPERLVPVGHTVGIKLFSEGVLVVGLSQVESTRGECSPAKECGLKVGDVILEADGEEIEDSEHFRAVIAQSGGEDVDLTVLREGETVALSAKGVEGRDGTVRLGAWIRDSLAGIGTMTFYDPESGVFGTLGHGINDTDTQVLMPLETGAIMYSTVKAVKPGEAGVPGELKGNFDLRRDLGALYANTDLGVFGTMAAEEFPWREQTLEVASAEDVSCGKAEILSNISGDAVERYVVMIEEICDTKAPNRNFILRVTDDRLLAATGGIVQGMSGSPILQNGRIVGAVTHVLVNDPTRGYGIFIENMLEAAG